MSASYPAASEVRPDRRVAGAVGTPGGVARATSTRSRVSGRTGTSRPGAGVDADRSVSGWKRLAAAPTSPIRARTAARLDRPASRSGVSLAGRPSASDDADRARPVTPLQRAHEEWLLGDRPLRPVLCRRAGAARAAGRRSSRPSCRLARVCPRCRRCRAGARAGARAARVGGRGGGRRGGVRGRDGEQPRGAASGHHEACGGDARPGEKGWRCVVMPREWLGVAQRAPNASLKSRSNPTCEPLRPVRSRGSGQPELQPDDRPRGAMLLVLAQHDQVPARRRGRSPGRCPAPARSSRGRCARGARRPSRTRVPGRGPRRRRRSRPLDRRPHGDGGAVRRCARCSSRAGRRWRPAGRRQSSAPRAGPGRRRPPSAGPGPRSAAASKLTDSATTGPGDSRDRRPHARPDAPGG